MTLRAILSKTTTDKHKSRIENNNCSFIALDCYISPAEFAQLLLEYDEKEFEVEIK